MILRRLPLLLALLLPAALAAQQGPNGDERTFTLADQVSLAAHSFTTVHQENVGYISSTHQIGVIAAGASTLSITITPCVGIQATSPPDCATPVTATGTTTTLTSVPGIYDFYTILITWTGTATSVKLHILGTHASASGGGPKTGAGPYVVSAASVPADGCGQFTSGQLGSTGVACGGGGGATLQTLGVANASQLLLNHIASTANASGLAVTPSNPSGGIEKYEVSGNLNAPNVAAGALANGMTATTQAPGDVTTKLATDAFAGAAATAAQAAAIAASDPVGAAAATYTATQTLTNKRITQRVLALSANSATPAVNTDSYDVVHITAQTATITGFTMTGTPVDGDKLRISITGTAAVPFTLGTAFEASTIALPTTTTSTARLDMGFFWNTETSKWRIVATQ